ncbi:MAG TPA: hypothetical protein VI895_11705 [Bdellovibrionota bacterium]|nr:hypothetical protein [Bdellovibrionota bacterium]
MAEMKYVYTIVEREGLQKKQWMKVGVAFVNRDQSLNLRLDALPVNGLLHVRDAQKSRNGAKPEEKPESAT